MYLRQYLSIMFIATALCWVAVGVVLYNIDPFQGSTLGFIFFYTSVLLALIGTLSIVFFFLYYVFARKQQPLYTFVHHSFRQGTTGALLLTLLLFLQGLQLLRLWSILALVGIFLFIGLFKASTSIERRHR